MKEVLRSRPIRKNLDSLAVYKESLLVTAKASDEILLYGKTNLKLLSAIERESGTKPNGISIANELLFYTEAEAKKLQIVSLKDFPRKFTIARSIEVSHSPYGVDAIHLTGGEYLVCVACKVSDCEGEVLAYVLRGTDALLVDNFEVRGCVESVKIDKKWKRLYVADETNRKVLALDLNSDYEFTFESELFSGFANDPEGIDFYGNYLVCTDQGNTAGTNLFHVFRRNTMEHVGRFRGWSTKNTDGVAFDRKTGMLYAIDNDSRVIAFNFKEITSRFRRFAVRAESLEESFENIWNLAFNFESLSEQGMHVVKPSSSEFDELYGSPLNFREKKSTFERKFKLIHQTVRSDLLKSAIEEKEDFFESIFAELVKLRDNWGFKLFRRYEIVATVWGTEGAYDHEDGVILLRVNREGRRTSAYGEPLEHTVVHEVVHIGIEEVIVRRYSLGHDMKEFLVDAICSIYLKELMPEYESQVDFRGMEVPKYDVIKGDLPGFIERPRARR